MSIEALYRDEATMRMLRAVLRSRGIRGQDLDDRVQDIFVSLLTWSAENPAKSFDELRRVARGTANNFGKQHLTKSVARAKRNVGLTGDADDHSALVDPEIVDPIDARRLIAQIPEMAESGTLTPYACAVILEVINYESVVDYAAETNQSYEAVRKVYTRGLDKVVAHIKAKGMHEGLGEKGLWRFAGAAAVAAAIILAIVYGDWLRVLLGQPIARHQRPPHPLLDVPQPVPQVPEVPELARESDEAFMARTQQARDEAAAALLKAEIAYKREDWRACMRQLAKAKTLDPTVDAPELGMECNAQYENEGNSKAPKRHP